MLNSINDTRNNDIVSVIEAERTVFVDGKLATKANEILSLSELLVYADINLFNSAAGLENSKLIFELNKLATKCETTHHSTFRVTANGEDIFDDSNTILSEITGISEYSGIWEHATIGGIDSHGPSDKCDTWRLDKMIELGAFDKIDIKNRTLTTAEYGTNTVSVNLQTGHSVITYKSNKKFKYVQISKFFGDGTNDAESFTVANGYITKSMASDLNFDEITWGCYAADKNNTGLYIWVYDPAENHSFSDSAVLEHISANRPIVEYVKANTVKTVKISVSPSYKVWSGGTETVISDIIVPNITQSYLKRGELNIPSIEERLNIAEQSIIKNTKDIDTANSNIETNRKNISSEAQRLDNTQATVTVNTAGINQHDAKLAEHTIRLTEHANKLTEHTSEIRAVEEAAASNKEQINFVSDSLKKYDVSNLSLVIDHDTYELIATIILKNGDKITSNIIDLPLETMVVNATYDDTTKEIILILKNGNEVRIDIIDIISDLALQKDLDSLSNTVTTLDRNVKRIDSILGYKLNGNSVSTKSDVATIAQAMRNAVNGWRNRNDPIIVDGNLCISGDKETDGNTVTYTVTYIEEGNLVRYSAKVEGSFWADTEINKTVQELGEIVTVSVEEFSNNDKQSINKFISLTKRFKNGEIAIRIDLYGLYYGLVTSTAYDENADGVCTKAHWALVSCSWNGIKEDGETLDNTQLNIFGLEYNDLEATGNGEFSFGQFNMSLEDIGGGGSGSVDVKDELINPSETWTADEQAAACETIGAVPKLTSVSGFNRVFAQSAGGGMLDYPVYLANYFDEASATRRNDGVAGYKNGELGCAIPTEDYRTANKKFVENLPNYFKKENMSEEQKAMWKAWLQAILE